jgi:putative ABC transport system permease protein
MSFILAILRLGLANLLLHKLRSFLTSLGIILGVAAVIIMVAITEGGKQAALRQIQALGATNVILRSQKPPEAANMSQERAMFVSYGMTYQDLRRITAAMTDALRIVPLKAAGDEISYEGARMTSQTFGTTPDLQHVASLQVEPGGRYLTQDDLEKSAPVAVIGSDVAKKFFTLRDPIGADFRIGDQVFRVIGVLRPVGLAGGSGSALVGRDLNLDVHIPFTTAESRFGDLVVRRSSGSMSGERIELSELYVQAPSTEDVINTAARVKRLLQVDHPTMADATIIVPWELLENEKRTRRMMNAMLTAIAAISLLVGGIGIMNIMLASVTERTREIGIRRALGATRRHIVAQFLVETGTLSAVGGLLGIGVGVSVSLLIGWVSEHIKSMTQYETDITTWSILLSFSVAASVGLIFGIYPAIMASRRDPIVALRHD